jgi:hypothetical protein
MRHELSISKCVRVPIRKHRRSGHGAECPAFLAVRRFGSAEPFDDRWRVSYTFRFAPLRRAAVEKARAAWPTFMHFRVLAARGSGESSDKRL